MNLAAFLKSAGFTERAESKVDIFKFIYLFIFLLNFSLIYVSELRGKGKVATFLSK